MALVLSLRVAGSSNHDFEADPSVPGVGSTTGGSSPPVSSPDSQFPLFL
ncbi:MAG: hypothetical protein IKL63_00865 [Alistipes sp.]|nr:hypothetical protein [Alistipes sp.]